MAKPRFNVAGIIQMVMVTALAMAIINRVPPLRAIVSPGVSSGG